MNQADILEGALTLTLPSVGVWNMNHTMIYRVEHAIENVGPYNSYAAQGRFPELQELRFALCSEHAGDSHPNGWIDLAAMSGDQHFQCFQRIGAIERISPHCGFESKEQMLRWFAGFGDALAKCGFVVKVFRVRNDRWCKTASGKQILFYKPNFPHKILNLLSAFELDMD